MKNYAQTFLSFIGLQHKNYPKKLGEKIFCYTRITLTCTGCKKQNNNTTSNCLRELTRLEGILPSA
ncbi:CLUMA_CG006750, isoform A [Clunio marinus]|uniref:CLUMA_CG006750, isoform A n=1 Tax=Clunio marinus TaxID=568069 RepID=A0A1J1I2X4_9DIPT|nr:CLUMA_CG006750, isoform A [Clunio marinus]